MATVVRMPSVLAGATEAAIARWLVSPGDTVTVDTPIAEIETEKALVEYAAEEAGIVGRLVLGEGDTGEIGDPIAVLVAAGETDADIDAAVGVAPSSPAPVSPAVPAGSAASASAPPAPVAGDAATLGTNGHQTHADSGRVFASPLVRKLAGERGIDLAGLAGTGPNGRIVRRDLERFLAAPAVAASAAAPAAPVTGLSTAPVPAGPASAAGRSAAEQALVRDEASASARPTAGSAAGSADGTLIPHTPMRRAIARRLAESKATVPHFYMTA